MAVTALRPSPKMQFTDASGNLLSGGKLYTYSAGTTTNLATYTDSTGTTPNTNPVVLDSRGEASVWFQALNYKLVLKDSSDNTIWTQDNYSGSPYPITDEWITYVHTWTYISATQVSVPGDQTAIYTTNKAIRAVCTGGTFYGTLTGAVYDGSTKTTLTVDFESGSFDSGVGGSSTISIGVQSSESPALTYATAASASAAAAAASESAAATSETNAASSASAAATSATNASNSATAAAGSATTASGHATTATTKAGEASTSATNAATSATTATTKASEASTSATNAANSATSASTSATNAANSATAAATSETNAAASAAVAQSGAAFVDSNPVVKGSADATKQVRFEVDGLTSGQTRVLTVPDADLTLVGAATVQTLTNKTFTGYTETVYPLTGTDINPANGTVQTKTLTGNTTFTESLADGQSVVLMLNPATFSATWPTVSWVNAAGSGAAPTLKASAVNVVVLWQVGGTLYGNWIGSL